MKIDALHLFRRALPIAGKPYTMASGSLTEVDTLLLKLTLDTGDVGWGETCPLGPTYAAAHAGGAEAALKAMLHGLIGTDAAPQPVHHQMDALLNGHSYAKAAVDIALFDALGHAYGVPVSTLLGGALVSRLPAYYAIGMEQPKNVTKIATNKIKAGYRRLQLKAGGRPLDEDIAAIQALYEAGRGTGTRLVIDANRGWTVRDAITISQACRKLPIIIEQPCNTLAEHQQLRPHLCHPLYLDESINDLDAAISTIGSGLADGFGVKITRLGGLAPALTFRDICGIRNLPHTADDSWGGDIIAAACLHFAATVRPDLLDGVWIAQPHINKTSGYPLSIAAHDGYLDVPQGPGLGVTPDEKLLGDPVEVFV